MNFKSKLFDKFSRGYLDGNSKASIQEINNEFDKYFYRIRNDAKNIAKKNKESGKWWLSIEGRNNVREIWNSDDDIEHSIPLIYLNEIERLESIIEDYNRNRYLFKPLDNWNQNNE